MEPGKKYRQKGGEGRKIITGAISLLVGTLIMVFEPEFCIYYTVKGRKYECIQKISMPEKWDKSREKLQELYLEKWGFFEEVVSMSEPLR